MTEFTCVVCGLDDVTVAHLEEEIVRLITLSYEYELPKAE